MRQTDLDRIAKKRLKDDGVFDICEFALPGVHPAAQSEYDPVHWKWFQEAFDCPIIDINQVSYSLLPVTQARGSLRPYAICKYDNRAYLVISNIITSIQYAGMISMISTRIW